MKINSRGQVTIPHAVRKQTGLHPHEEVQFEMRANGDVVLRASTQPNPTQDVLAAFSRVRGSANSRDFKGMGTDEFMALIRS